MDSTRTSKFDPEQFKSAVLSACDALWTTSKAEMRSWKVFRSVFKRGKGTSVAQPVDEPVMKVENGSHMVGEHDRVRGSEVSEGETASASASTNAVDKCRSAGTPQKCRYQCFKRRQIRTIDTANKRHGGGPNIFGHYNHGYC